MRENILSIIGHQLNIRRLELKLTREQVAVKTGFPVEKIQQVEEWQDENLSINDLMVIADAIGLDVSIRFYEAPFGST